MEIKRLYNNFLRAEKRADIAEIIYGGDPESAEKEADFDRAYKEQHAAMMEVIREIERLTAGQIDQKTARLMLTAKRPEFERLMRRIA